MYDTDLDGLVSRAEVEEMMSAALDLEAERMSRQSRSRSRTCVDQLVPLGNNKKQGSPASRRRKRGTKKPATKEIEYPEMEDAKGEKPKIEHNPDSMVPSIDLTRQSQLHYIMEDAFGPATVSEKAEGEGTKPKTHLTLHEFRKFTEDNPASMNILEQVCLLCSYDRVSLLPVSSVPVIV